MKGRVKLEEKKITDVGLWRSVKHEEVYLKAYDTVKQAKQSIAEYLDFYNMLRPHSSLNKATPNEFYDQHLLKVMTA